MALYRIDVENGGETGTVTPDVGWRYTKNLNEVNEAELKFSGTGATTRQLLRIGATVTIYKNGTIDFQGLIDNTDYFIGGTVVFHASGWEVWLAKENGTYSNSPWNGTASATIFSELIAESAYINAGTINAGFSMDFRLATSTSLFNAISNLANKTSQDISMDYTASPVEMSILNHVGSTTSVAVLNEGKEISNVRRSIGYPRGNNIIVWGKGDGDNQIKGSDSDGTSIAAYGTITMNVVDKSIMTTGEANRLASAELALNKDPPNIYDFELTNPDRDDLSLGDVITLNALDQDVNNDEVRIVGIEEGEQGSDIYITLQTTNPELKTLMKTKNKIIARLKKEKQDDQTYMQGNSVTNEWGAGINGDSSHAAKVGFYVPPEFDTEDGSLDVRWMKCDYDIDPYNSQFGDASFTGADPQVQNDSGDKDAGVSGSSANNDALVDGTSADEDAIVDGTSASTTPSDAAGVSVWATYTVDYSVRFNQSLAYVEENIVGSATYYTTRMSGYFMNATGSSQTADRSVQTASGSSASSSTSIGNNSVSVYTTGNSSSSNTSGWCRAWDDNYNITICSGVHQNIYEHDHSSHTHGDGSYLARDHDHADGSYYAVDHLHGDGSYLAASHNHPDGSYDVNAADLNHISIGDSVSDAGSVNATGATIYLDYWNGSSWINKYSVAYLSDTLKENVDITDGGTFPDTDGYWRVRVTPNSASADFVNAKVRLKFKIDN